MLNIISISIVPAIIIIIIVHGYIKGVDIYSAFIEGAKEGLKTSISIMPYLIAIFVAVGIFRGSTVLDIFTHLLSPITNLLGLPKEILPLTLIRPISGSGALGVVKDIIANYGPDSFIGNLASIMMGSSETIFYTITLYFGSVGIEDYSYTLKAALISYIISIFLTTFICSAIYII
ncbi:spore maturation protein B [Keratinibaculum paraultunense]|uniref:Spore maturation protein B n=1 Tax=Keratinibaculum paraultunense TaxID=1278232 RepID=A0A4R3KU42_9FIRM|nr:nucleoside recognition domain-containing protein [Keratinibaculum paraultunense]QQY79879.1 spore maturation protein [Keratinibaculum paraultunense]TCS88765.1 spore maturation protein B [Keratinibaculum paraultunense]